MKPVLFKLAGISMIAFSLLSCKKIPDLKARLNFEVNNIDTNSVSAKRELRFETFTLNLNTIEFSARKDEKDFAAVAENSSYLDLAQSSSFFSSISLAEGFYRGVHVKLEIKRSESAPSVFLKGTYSDEKGNSTPLEIYVNEPIDIDLPAEDLLVFGNRNYKGEINVDLDKLLSSIAIYDIAIAQKTNGVVMINSSSNINLYNKVKSAMKNSFVVKFAD
ncbi:hypothetical protein [Rubrolithibacter danxiaensis]|uniref:hypothetical protein n=1 Tax=Rubrolithibacter danxiaensis TaxID=3390805 RepID=UPI003BF84701